VLVRDEQDWHESCFILYENQNLNINKLKPVPESGTMLLLSFAMLGLAGYNRRCKKNIHKYSLETS
jgi:hypothetical protein